MYIVDKGMLESIKHFVYSGNGSDGIVTELLKLGG